MATSARSVPLTYAELAAAIESGAYPHERSWIDFKRRLYPDSDDATARDKVSQELARDMASMAERGGYLIYGVKENKAGHTFTVDKMPLPVGLHETVDAVARDRITPSLAVVPTLVPAPETGNTAGFLVVEVPESADSPHMTDFTYWGRSETGRVRLNDDQVERLILARSQRYQRLPDGMKATARVDPVGDRWLGHFYFTAVPTRGWPEMFAQYTRDAQARTRLLRRVAELEREISADHDQRPWPTVLGGFVKSRRTQKVQAGWLDTWDGRAAEGKGWSIGVDDDGPVRLIDLEVGSGHPPGPSSDFLKEARVLYRTRDMIRLTAALSDDVGYHGNWLLGVFLDGLYGCKPQLADPLGETNSFEDYDYSSGLQATGLQLRSRAEWLTSGLLRTLMRGLGTEILLIQPPFGSR
jgi:hypothetical protein